MSAKDKTFACIGKACPKYRLYPSLGLGTMPSCAWYTKGSCFLKELIRDMIVEMRK